ncbi:MAG: T9SS type A sorting domain-containing protein [Bacteroidota bacterium]
MQQGNFNNATGTKTFTGDVTLNSGTVWNETAAAVMTFAGNFTNNATTFTASTGVHTFSGATKTIGGTTANVIPSATFTGNYTNSGTLTCATALTVTGAAVVLTNNSTITAATALSGTGALTNAATYTLNIGGTCSITTLTNAGTTAITGAGAISTALANFTNTGTLNLGGSGTIAGITNNTAGIVNLSNSGTITSFNNATSTSTLNISALTVPTITTLTVTTSGNTINYSGAGAQTVKDVAYSNLTISGSGTKTWTETAARIMTGNLSVGDGATLNVAGAFAFTVTGTTTIGSGTSGTLSITNATGTKTFTSAVTINSGGAITETAAAQLAFGSDVTINGTLTLSGAAAVGIAGNFANNGTFTCGTSTVIFNGTSGQSISGSAATTFNNLTLNNSAGLSLSNSITVIGICTLTNGALSVGANTLTFQTSNTPIVRTSGTITTTTSSNLVFGTAGNTGGAAFAIPNGTFTSAPSINNFTINRTNSLTLNDQMMSLNGILLCNGPLTTNGNLTLLSTASQTALIDGSSSGQVSGNVTMQRYLPSGFGYKYVSSPFQASTVNEFSNDLDLTATFPTFYKYDESMTSSGWVSYTTTTNPLIPMHGYAANFGAAATAKTVDVAGVVNNGILSITLYNNNQPFTLGFNLAGNPYPSPINWDAASGWTKTNIDNALYYFQAGIIDQYTGTYSTYINGISSDGLATNIIPSMQGFFIHVSNGSFPVTGTLGFANSVRTNDLTHPFLKSTRTDSQPLLRITAGFENNKTPSDPAVIYFDSSATQLFDKNLDALKLMNTDIHVPNLYTMTSDSKRLSISAIPYPVDSIRRIPLGLKTAEDGWITFKASDIQLMPTERYIYLVDSEAGINQDLKLNLQYRFFLKAGEYENRFSLVFSLTVLNNFPTEFSLLQNYPNPFNPRTTIKYLIPQTSFVSITVYDILGKEVTRLVNEEKLSGTYEVLFDGGKLSSGVYFYRLHAGSFLKTNKLMLLK